MRNRYPEWHPHLQGRSARNMNGARLIVYNGVCFFAGPLVRETSVPSGGLRVLSASGYV